MHTTRTSLLLLLALRERTTRKRKAGPSQPRKSLPLLLPMQATSSHPVAEMRRNHTRKDRLLLVLQPQRPPWQHRKSLPRSTQLLRMSTSNPSPVLLPSRPRCREELDCHPNREAERRALRSLLSKSLSLPLQLQATQGHPHADHGLLLGCHLVISKLRSVGRVSVHKEIGNPGGRGRM
jgi:hypothetical protein